MREVIKLAVIRIGQTVIATTGILALLAFILFVAFKYFSGWGILAALAIEIAGLVFIFHLYRWLRYPGLFQSKAAGQLFSEILLSILFIYSIPLIAILAKLHIAEFLPLDTVGYKLGLEFKFKMHNVVRVRTDAPFHPGEVGRVTKIRVATESRASPLAFQAGEAIYSIRSVDGIFEASERYLLVGS